MVVETYKEFIQNILDTRGQFGIPKIDENGKKIYKERHHIRPKCLGGTNDKNNLIDLYAKEHFIAHKLLAEENPTNNSLIYAWWNMCQIKGRDYQDRYIPTVEEYEKARIAISLMESECRMGDKNPMFGKHIPVSEETKEKLRQINLGRKMSPDAIEKMRQAKIGKKLTEEHKLKISKSCKGHGRHGKPILCVELNRVFQSALEAERETGVANTNIGYVCRNKRKTAGGYHWQYIE